MKKLDQLSPEQITQLPGIVEEWTKIGLCTEPADRPRAEAALTAAYKQADLPVPRFVWCGSPLAGVRDSIRDNVGTSVRANLRANLRDNVRTSVYASIRDNVSASVITSVSANVRDNVKVRVSVNAMAYGQHDAHWLAFYDTFRRSGLADLVAPLEPLMELAKSANWARPHEGVCWISDRHNVVRMDDNQRLHCETGPALQYPDGWSIYCWHGVPVPESWIKNRDDLRPEEVLCTEDVEQRAAGLSIIGMRRMLDHLDHTIIDSSPDPQLGDLIEIRVPGLPESELYLKFRCPRNGEMMEPVDKRALAAPDLHHAHAWHSRLPARLFSKPQQRS